MTADMGMYDKLLNEVSLDITNNKTTPGTIWRGVEDSALDWFTVGITLQEAMGEDLKLTDEKGRPKPLVKAVKVKKADLSKLTKVKLEEFALATYGVDIDRRKKKDELVKEVLKLSKKV